MEITIKNKIRLKKIPSELQERLIGELKIENPKYKEAVQAGRSTWEINPFIYNFEILPDDSLRIPRGYRKKLFETIEEMGIKAKVIDDRPIIDQNFGIDSSKIKYRPYQYNAVMELIKSEEGILVAPAGSGKTVMGISLIPLYGWPTLWLTHTGPLAEQVVNRINFFLPSLKKDDIGLIGRGKWKIGKVLTVAMIQTLVRRIPQLYKIRDSFGLIILDECLVDNTKILMLDGSIKNIEDIKNGEITTFGKISNKFDRIVDKTIKLRGSWGNIEGSTTHVLPYIPHKHLRLNKHKNTFEKFVEKDVIFDSMGNIEVDDFLLLQESFCHTEKHIVGKRRSRLLALINCDGHIQKDLRCLQVGIVKDKAWFLREMISNTSYVDNPDIRTSNCKRGDLIIRCYSKELVKNMLEFIPAGKKSRIIKIPSIMMNASKEDIKEFLQVVFDTEGSVTDQITLTMAAHDFVYGIQFLLMKFGIAGRITPIRKKNHLRISISGYDALLFWKKIKFSMHRKQRKLTKLMTKTAKFKRIVNYKGINYRCIKVLEKDIIKKKTRVHDFTTDQHLFVANGILSSNCHHAPASTFMKVLGCFNPYHLYGLTATPYRRDKLQKLMFQTIGEEVVRISIEEVEKYGGVMRPTIKYKAFKHPKIVSGSNTAKIMTENIMYNDKRNHMIISDVLKEAAQGNICIVLSGRKTHCEVLYELISIAWDKIGIATGDYNRKYVTEQIEKLNSGEITVLVCTDQLLGEGFDYAPLNRAFLAAPFRSEAKCEQIIGRIQRSAPGKKNALVYDYVDVNIGVIQNQFYSKGNCRYAAYERLGVNIEPC